MKKMLFLSLFAVLIFLPVFANSWTGNLHDYLCPENLSVSCGIGDSLEFKKSYIFGTFNHLCYDGRADCVPRLVASYYVKKYYVEGRGDSNLLGGAAHLFQDSFCPDHWYPMREFFGKIFVPFAPSWVATIEPQVEHYISSQQKDWNIPIEFRGQIININKDYLDSQKENMILFLAQEPKEGLQELENRINSRIWIDFLRGYKEWIMVMMIIALPLLGYYAFKWKKKRENKTELIFFGLFSCILIFLLLIILLFY